MTPKARYYWSMAIILTVAVLYSTWLGVRWHDCSESGGKYVRGVFTMECIHPGR